MNGKIIVSFLLILFGFVFIDSGNAQEGSVSEIQSTDDEENLAKAVLRDGTLSVEEYVSGLEWPTTMAFIDEDILVLEKGGNVRLVENGELKTEPILKIDVSRTIEGGLLGVLVDDTTVYLHFTNEDTENKKTSNWYYKYEWKNKQLVEPELIKVIHDGSGRHNSGPMILHPDGTIYAIIGDLLNREGKLQNFSEGEPDDTSVIFSLNKQEPYYAIGIRNSFGLTYDPMTNNLWDTENGPEYFDEINYVIPKFNSGWKSIQGPAKLNQIEELPIFEDYRYSEPEFSWEIPVGVTAISFIQSEYFEKYHNSVLVGDFNTGAIWKFELNENRDGFVFNDPDLKDLVLNKDDSTDEILFGTGFAGATDIEEGPDGKLYILSIGQGKIFRISQNNEVNNIEHCSQQLGIDINLSGCKLAGKNFEDVDLSNANLSFTDLENASFKNVNLNNAIMSASNLKNANFKNVDLSNSDMNLTILENANLENVNLENSNLKAIEMINVNLDTVNLNNADLDHGVFKNSNMKNVQLKDSNISWAKFQNAVLNDVNISNSVIEKNKFQNSNFNNVNISNSRIWVNDFTNSKMYNVDFSNSDIYQIDYSYSTLEKVDFRDTKLGTSKFIETSFSKVNLLEVYPFSTDFDGSVFADDNKINTCLESDLYSKIINKVLREIRENFTFFSFMENILTGSC